LLICGPNCYGVFNIRLGSAAYSADLQGARPGAVAVVSQSGGFSHAIAEHLMQQRCVGLSYIVSCGNQAGLSVEDYLEFLVADEDTAVIGVFVEGFRRPDKLRDVAARAARSRKPIVALKVGRSENARQAMLAHTGSLAGTPQITDAVLKQSGIVQVAGLNEMIDTLALMSQARTLRRGFRVAVLSGLGGECGRTADVADRVGIDLPPLSASSIETLLRAMPDFASPRNPLDGTGAMYENPEIFPRLLEVLLTDETIDVVALNMRANVPKPGGWAPSREFSHAIHEALKKGTDRLVLCFSSFPGGDLDQEVVRLLADVGVPFLEGTETALLALRHMRDHRAFLDRPEDCESVQRSCPRRQPAPPGPRGPLANVDAMRLLREYGIPLADTRPAADADEAVRVAENLGYPVALKVDTQDIAHKSDVGGVQLGCGDAGSVRQSFEQILEEVRRRAPGARVRGVLVQRMIAGGTEMILGVKRDPIFGPAIVCGLGGIFVESLGDVSIRVPPVSLAEARRMIAELRCAALLKGPRGRPPSDIDALAETLVRLAMLADAQRERVAALDLNPVVVLDEGHGVVAVDWLVELA
jgi:acyl-CoA synthetase (NDP forming)